MWKKPGSIWLYAKILKKFHWKQNSCLHFALKHLIGINASNTFLNSQGVYLLGKSWFVRITQNDIQNITTNLRVLTRFKRFLDVNMHFRIISPSTLYVMQSMSESYWTQAPLIISTASIWVSLQMILHWKFLLSEYGGIYS